MSLAARPVEQLHSLTNFRLPAKENRRVLFAERPQSRIGRVERRPFAGFGRHDAFEPQSVPEPLIPLRLVRARIDALRLGENGGEMGCLTPRLDLKNKEIFAFHPCQGHLSEAPLGGQVMAAAEGNHRTAGTQLGVEGALPTHPRLNARFWIQVEENRAVTLFRQASFEFPGGFRVSAAVADEKRAHRTARKAEGNFRV